MQSYELPHRVHVATAYPIPSPNGSTIIVCGHEQGLLVVWRGGRSFKSSAKAPEKKPAPAKANGTQSDVINLDSDSDEEASPPTQPYIDEPAFEDQESDYDPFQPYESIIQTLELPLSTDVLHLAFPQLSPDLHSSNLGSLPKMMMETLLVAVACADCSIRLITIPLLPPSPQSKARPEARGDLSGPLTGQGLFGDSMFIIGGGNSHQSLPKGISVALTCQSNAEEEDMEVDQAEQDQSNSSRASSRAPSRNRSRSRSWGEKRNDEGNWNVLIASHSSDGSGLLLVHRIPILEDGSAIDLEAASIESPWRTQYLASPATSMKFNTSLYPASSHCYLLLVEPRGIVRIFDCQSDPRAERGSWLISLYSDYESSVHGLPRRKEVLAAQWVLAGKAVAVLLSDGEWGVWDLENKGPKNKKDTPQWKHSAGADPTEFAVGDRISDSSSAKQSAQSSAVTKSTSRLAPMTPGTRRVRQESLFTGPATKSNGPVRGGISVLPASDGPNNRADDETLLLWHGELITTIPSLLTYWQNQVKASGNLFGNGGRGRPRELNNVRLGGEMRNGASLIPNHPSGAATFTKTNTSKILVVGEHRFVVAAPQLTQPPASDAPKSLSIRSGPADQALLAKGELDVNGIEHMLDNMSNGQQINGHFKNGLLSKIR